MVDQKPISSDKNILKMYKSFFSAQTTNIRKTTKGIYERTLFYVLQKKNKIKTSKTSLLLEYYWVIKPTIALCGGVH